MITSQSGKAIDISGLKVGYSTRHDERVFFREHITFSAQKGEMIALIGPNGVGKSTLLRTMAGFLKSLAGEIRYYNDPVSLFSIAELARLISFVSTENINVPNLRVAELAAYGRFPFTNWLGVLKAPDRKMVMDALEKVGLQDFARRKVSQLSDGERQRAQIARALVQDTPFILLDEPTSFLDINNKYGIFQLLHQLAREHEKTIVLSTHDLNIAIREMDKFWIMLDNGSFEGAPEDAVLQGWINRLFTDGKIGFNEESGDFNFVKNHAGTAFVSGEGIHYLWTIKALERKGYLLVGSANADVSISVGKENHAEFITWTMFRNGQNFQFSSIYELLNQL